MGAGVRRRIAVMVLMLPLAAAAGQSAATFYALNCMGCHPTPQGAAAAPPGGRFAHTDGGRIFFIALPRDGTARMSVDEDARLMREILTWKRSCTVILQQAPLVRYSGDRVVK
jgi:hypothetical protein